MYNSSEKKSVIIAPQFADAPPFRFSKIVKLPLGICEENCQSEQWKIFKNRCNVGL